MIEKLAKDNEQDIYIKSDKCSTQIEDSCHKKNKTVAKLNNFIPICLTSLFIMTFRDIFKHTINVVGKDNYIIKNFLLIFIIVNLYILYNIWNQ